MVNDQQELLNNKLHLKQLELNSLLEITQAINANLSEESLYKIYHFTLLANLKIKKLALYVLDKDWDCKVNFGTLKNYKKKPICDKVLEFATITEINEQYEGFEEFDLAIPVTHKSRVLAYVFVGGIKEREENEEADISFVQTFTNIIIVAIENKKLARKELAQEALRKELEIAKEVQTLLFPKSLPDNNHVKIHATYIPHQTIGGDYYDYIPLDDSSFLVCVADVSGKGIPAALLMSNFQASLRTLIRKTTALREIVKELNHIILNNANGERFITFFIAVCNYKKRKLKYINAGHNPPILLNNGEIISLDRGTTILGVFPNLPNIEEAEIDLEDNAFLFSYTDGLTETENEEQEEFGVERVKEVLTCFQNKNLEQLHRSLLEKLNEFKGKGNYCDDITCLSCLIF
ncbi:MAG TPA: PP2C family protein-serine/threonine phosphatase [Cytophagaceae bacterium]